MVRTGRGSKAAVKRVSKASKTQAKKKTTGAARAKKSTTREKSSSTESSPQKSAKSESGKKSLPEDLDLIAQDEKSIDQVVQRAFDLNKDFLSHSLVKKLEAASLGTISKVELGAESQQWQEIESMSRLRGIVGGRFQNLKERWIQAGFPLREHRGDKRQEFEVNELGWIELSNWISRQGYEVRLRPDKSSCLFEIRDRDKG